MIDREASEQEMIKQVRSTETVTELKSLVMAANLFKAVAWAVGLGCMAAIVLYPGLITLIPGAILTYIAADADCNIDNLKRVIQEEIQRRFTDK
jgi:hypothetical protein